MTLLNQLRLYSDALAAAVENDRDFFISVIHFVRELQRLSRASRSTVSLDEILLNVTNIQSFFAEWPHSQSLVPGALYVQPRQIRDSEPTVHKMVNVISEMAKLSGKEFMQLFPSKGRAKPRPKKQTKRHRIFIGHGRSPTWKELKDFLSERLHLDWDEFNREPAAGLSTKERLQEMLDNATFAFLIMTGEDASPSGSIHPRENVIHESGLFQGRLGFERSIILLEEGCAEFSNIHGLTQIRFPKGNIKAVFEEIRKVLERERMLG